MSRTFGGNPTSSANALSAGNRLAHHSGATVLGGAKGQLRKPTASPATYETGHLLLHAVKERKEALQWVQQGLAQRGIVNAAVEHIKERGSLQGLANRGVAEAKKKSSGSS